MNTRDAANSKADANLPLAAAREAKKMEFSGRLLDDQAFCFAFMQL